MRLLSALKLRAFRSVALSLAMLLAAGGPTTGALRALLTSTSPFYEQSETRPGDVEEKSKAAPRRFGFRVGGVAEAAPVWSSRNRSHSHERPPAMPVFTDSAENSHNGIGAPLRC